VSAPKRIALATCRNLPGWEVDDRPLVAALVERGAEIVQPAWDDPDVDWGAHDACLVRTTWDYTEQRDAFVAWAERASMSAPLFNPPEVVRWNTHKGYLADLERAGVRIAPTEWLARGERPDLGRILERRGWRRGFLKPCVGATARETLRFDVDDLAAAQAHVDRLLESEDLMLQPYLASVETEGELSAIVVEGEPTHAVRKVPVSGDFRVQDDFGASDEPYAFSRAELEVVRGVTACAEQRFGRLLYARVDLLRDDAGALVLNELELVEPSLFLRHGPNAGAVLADALLARIR
jgi:glutathione synthase/RimK-type ligase-like ATP-grasp enzyme